MKYYEVFKYSMPEWLYQLPEQTRLKYEFTVDGKVIKNSKNTCSSHMKRNYTNPDRQRELTRIRVRRFRERQKMNKEKENENNDK